MDVLVVGTSNFICYCLSKVDKAKLNVECMLISSVKKDDVHLFDDFDVIVFYIPTYSRYAMKLLSLLDDDDKNFLFLTYSKLLARYIMRNFSDSKELCDPKFEEEKLLKEISGLIVSDVKTKIVLLKDANEPDFTDREVEIIALLSLGHTQVQIAKMLYVAEKTIYNHVTNIKRKLEASTVTEAIASAIRFGVID